MGYEGEISPSSERDNTDDETSVGAERVDAGWMRHYDRIREGYDGPLEEFPRLSVEQVESGSLASELDFDDCRPKFDLAGTSC